MKFGRLRAVVACVFFVALLVGLATHAATGSWSAWGISSIAAVCPVGILEVFVGSKVFAWHPFLLLVFVVALVVVFGRAFCGWICPVPWIERFFHPKGKRKKGKNDNQNVICDDDFTEVKNAQNAEGVTCSPAVLESASNQGLAAGNSGSKSAHTCVGCAGCASGSKKLDAVGGKRDGVQIDSRHFVLLGALGSAAIFGFPVFCLVCPVGLTAATIVGLWHLFQFNEPSLALIIAPAIVLVEVVFFRKWCAKICPISALFGLISRFNFTFKPRVVEHACLRSKGIDCHACVDACPEALDPHSRNIPECTKCGACATACPAKAIKFK